MLAVQLLRILSGLLLSLNLSFGMLRRDSRATLDRNAAGRPREHARDDRERAGDRPPFHEGRSTAASRRKSRCRGRLGFTLRILGIHKLNSRRYPKVIAHSGAEFFWAFLIYIDLPPSAEPFERSAAFAREEFRLIHVEALGFITHPIRSGSGDQWRRGRIQVYRN